MGKHIIEAIKGEQIKTAIPWDLTIFDDETEEIKHLIIYEYADEDI